MNNVKMTKRDNVKLHVLVNIYMIITSMEINIIIYLKLDKNKIVYSSNSLNTIIVLSLRFEVALMHIPYTVEFINRKLTNRIDF